MSAKVLDQPPNPIASITEGHLESALLSELQAEHRPNLADTARPLAVKTENLTRIYKVKGQKKGKGEKNDNNGSAKTLLALDGVDLVARAGRVRID